METKHNGFIIVQKADFIISEFTKQNVVLSHLQYTDNFNFFFLQDNFYKMQAL